MDMDTKLANQVWRRLIDGKPLEGLGLPMIGGRLDLRGLVAPAPSVVRRFRFGAVDVAELDGCIVIRGVHWKGLDLSASILGSLRFFDCSIEDCSFEGARCKDWRMWGTVISNTNFGSADLRGAALGGIMKGKRNSFQRVDFTNADLRGTAYVSADMVECTFANTKLSKVEFNGTVFVNCTFAGEMNEVIFSRHAFRGEGFPANEMTGVDFRHAKFRFVEFRELDMLNVKWPEDEEHIVIDDYRNALDRALNSLKGRSDILSKKLAALVGMKRKWAGPNQKQGVVSRVELIEVGGETAVRQFLSVIGMSR